MPFGPQAHCGLDKGGHKRAVSAPSVQKGSETKEGNLSRAGNNDGGIVGSSAVKAHQLAPTKVLQPFT